MNPKIELIKGKVGLEKHFEKFRHELKQFAETHRIVNLSTTLDVQDGTLYATILYEECFMSPDGREKYCGYVNE